jgi:WD40 repeat protein
MTGRAIATFDAHAGTVRSLAIAHDGRIATVHERGDVRVWDVTTQSSRLLAKVREPRAISLSGDGATAAVGDADGFLSLLALDGSTSRRFPGTDPIFAVKMSRDGRKVVAGTTTGKVVVWDTATGSMRELGRQPGFPVIELSPNGRHAAVASTEGELVLWDTEDGTRAPLVGHVGVASALGFIDDDQLVSGGDDGSLRTWDVATARTRSLLQLDHKVTALVVRDRIVFAGTNGGQVFRCPFTAFGDPPPDAATAFAGFLEAMTDARLDASDRLDSSP